MQCSAKVCLKVKTLHLGGFKINVENEYLFLDETGITFGMLQLTYNKEHRIIFVPKNEIFESAIHVGERSVIVVFVSISFMKRILRELSMKIGKN